MACNDWNSALQGDPDASLTPVQSNLMTSMVQKQKQKQQQNRLPSSSRWLQQYGSTNCQLTCFGRSQPMNSRSSLKLLCSL
jgi:hypothetical protein